MKRTPRVIVILSAIGLLVLGLVTLCYFRGEEPRETAAAALPNTNRLSKSPSPSTERDNYDSKKRLKQMKRAISELRKAGRDDTLTPEQQKIEDTNRDYDVAQLYNREALHVLDKMLNEQEKDFKWSTDVQAEAEDLLRDEKYSGTTFSDVTCGTTLCKMTLAHVDKEARDSLVNGDFTEVGSWDGDQVGKTLTQNDGSHVSQFFFTKKGDYEPFVELSERLAVMAGHAPSEQYSHLALQQQ